MTTSMRSIAVPYDNDHCHIFNLGPGITLYYVC